MADQDGLLALRSALSADGYELDVRHAGDRVAVRISATPAACADCLVPEPVMRGILGRALGIDEDSIDITYPRGTR
ncbi:MAG TPA: hypothetical protein VGX25_06170 [Actinophytocola sp.]|uniref:hypothetical protein n=1 Tax=Actinophytocola sp. TaxID=1872138 RepID=UPI002DDD2251|nr:hypothetical protein [Actinophytocola sp.]HEV2778972.1 hypothetical protein [Actinophytocola sp.]